MILLSYESIGQVFLYRILCLAHRAFPPEPGLSLRMGNDPAGLPQQGEGISSAGREELI